MYILIIVLIVLTPRNLNVYLTANEGCLKSTNSSAITAENLQWKRKIKRTLANIDECRWDSEQLWTKVEVWGENLFISDVMRERKRVQEANHRVQESNGWRLQKWGGNIYFCIRIYVYMCMYKGGRKRGREEKRMRQWRANYCDRVTRPQAFTFLLFYLCFYFLLFFFFFSIFFISFLWF